MPKYSFIVTAYNVEKYINKCIKSILNQTFDDYNIILVDDGSNDHTRELIEKIKSNKIKYYYQKNGGVSAARNYGISKVKSEYFLFVDGDDYIDKNLLQIVDNNITNKIDVLSFNIVSVNEKDEVLEKIDKPAFDSICGYEAIKNLINGGVFFDTPVAYVYKTSYFKNNHFTYAKGRYHEDFGLTPLIILKAKNVISINLPLYYYVQRNNSITTTKDYEKTIKKTYDMLYHFDYLFKKVNSDKQIDTNTKHLFNSYIANAIINKASVLEDTDRKAYINELKKRHVASLVLGNNPKRLLKKIILMLNINWYLKLK